MCPPCVHPLGKIGQVCTTSCECKELVKFLMTLLVGNPGVGWNVSYGVVCDAFVSSRRRFG